MNLDNLDIFVCIVDCAFGVDLGGPFFPGGHELWHHPLAYSAAAAAELPSAALQHATLVHPALHPQVPVRSYLWLNPEKMMDQVSTINITCSFNDFFYLSQKPLLVPHPILNRHCFFFKLLLLILAVCQLIRLHSNWKNCNLDLTAEKLMLSKKMRTKSQLQTWCNRLNLNTKPKNTIRCYHHITLSNINLWEIFNFLPLGRSFWLSSLSTIIISPKIQWPKRNNNQNNLTINKINGNEKNHRKCHINYYCQKQKHKNKWNPIRLPCNNTDSLFNWVIENPNFQSNIQYLILNAIQ